MNIYDGLTIEQLEYLLSLRVQAYERACALAIDDPDTRASWREVARREIEQAGEIQAAIEARQAK